MNIKKYIHVYQSETERDDTCIKEHACSDAQGRNISAVLRCAHALIKHKTLNPNQTLNPKPLNPKP